MIASVNNYLVAIHLSRVLCSFEQSAPFSYVSCLVPKISVWGSLGAVTDIVLVHVHRHCLSMSLKQAVTCELSGENTTTDECVGGNSL